MKKYLVLFLLFVMGGLVSCTQNNLNIKLLEQAENLMQAYPDSAMLLLNIINQPERLPGKERADYALLLAEALDKNYLDSLQSGPLIQIASDYYKSNNDYVKAGKASYYYGKVMASKDSLSEAMQAYLDALYFLKKADAYKLQGLVFEHIGYLNLEKRDGAEAGEKFRIKGKWDGIVTTFLYYKMYENATNKLLETKIIDKQ